MDKKENIIERTKPYRFPVNRKDHTMKHPEGYLKPLLKKLLDGKITLKDPITEKKLRQFGKCALVKAYFIEGIKGNVQAIEGIFDRMDGKVASNGNGKGGTTAVIIRIGTESGLLSSSQAARVSSERIEV